MLLKILLLGMILQQVSSMDSEGCKLDQNFSKAINYWSQVLCALSKTKTIIFHGVFANSSEILEDFYNILLQTTTENCEAVVSLKIHSEALSSNFPDPYSRSRCHNLVKGQGIQGRMTAVGGLDRKWHVKGNARTEEKRSFDLWNVNIIFLGNGAVFEELLDSGAPFEWNGREHFIVFAIWNDPLEPRTERRRWIDRILRKLWLQHRIQNVFFHEPLSEVEECEIHSYNPFAGINVTAWGKLESIRPRSKMHLLHLLSTMTYRRTINFNGYRFNVSMFDQVHEANKVRGKIEPNSIYAYSGGYNGTSGVLMGVLARKLNFQVNVVEPNTEERYGHQMKNGTFTGAIGDLIYHKVVASFAFFFVKTYIADMSLIDFTTTIGFDRVCVIAPKAGKIPKGFRIYHIFDPSVWLWLLLSHILVAVIWNYIQGSTSRSCRHFNIATTIVNLFLIAAGCPKSLPSSSAERRLLIGVFFSSVTIIGIFNGVLYQAFARDMFYKDIDSLAELDDSGLPIGFFSFSTTDLFGHADDTDLNPILKRLQKKLVHALDNVEQAALYRNMSGLLREQYYPLVRQSFVDETGTHMLHKVEECPAKFFLACLLPSNSILRERLNELISRLNEAGLPPFWRTISILRMSAKKELYSRTHREFEPRIFVAFQLSDLQFSFFVLVSGLAVSVIAFFNEKGWLKFRRPQ
ncbi:uncharacterized protein LOC143210803 [Lasioglossum baleicum]|uniref:uncharacterized protein LOC143210803 n=1 Tax=Lasioglossum baleicum TaxID=434251 RepID=UPI003FCD550C